MRQMQQVLQVKSAASLREKMGIFQSYRRLGESGAVTTRTIDRRLEKSVLIDIRKRF